MNVLVVSLLFSINIIDAAELQQIGPKGNFLSPNQVEICRRSWPMHMFLDRREVAGLPHKMQGMDNVQYLSVPAHNNVFNFLFVLILIFVPFFSFCDIIFLPSQFLYKM